MAASPSTHEPGSPFMQNGETPVFNIQGLSKSYKSSSETISPIQGLNLQVFPGELIMVYGPSGTGKTTLLNLMAGLDEPDGGSIEFHGEAFQGKSDREKTLLRRHRLGVIFQGFELIRSMNCRDNIAYPLVLQRIPREQRKIRVEETARELGIGEILNRKPDKISGGQQQRVAIARAMVGDYSCILGDEITGNLDRKNSRLVYELLRSGKGFKEKAFVLVSHDPELKDYADRVFDLTDGVLS